MAFGDKKFGEKKKPSLADVALADDDDEAPASEDGEEYSASVDELADVLGVADDKREAFASAFQAACMSCK